MKIIQKKLSEFSSIEVEKIVSFLDANFSTVFHEPDFNSVVSEVFKTQFSYNLVYNSDGRLIALCPLHSIRNGLLTTTYSNPAMYGAPYGGWVYDSNEVSLAELIQQMKLSYNEALTYWSFPQVDNDNYSQMENRRRFQTAIVDLEINEDFIWENSINSKRRNMIRKAQKNNILIEKADYTKFDDFYQLMRKTHQYTDLKIKPEEYYTKILKIYIPNNKAVILLAKMQSTLVSGVILLRNRNICHYWLGASKKETENLGQGDLLQWEAIKWAKENGSKYYDLCVVEPERLPHIARFKLGFSKKIVPFYLYTKRNLAYRIVSRLRRCF